ncbi:retrovirus-related pol polyprotein from transposon TNT 1-94 [Tanacetum coccineum]
MSGRSSFSVRVGFGSAMLNPILGELHAGVTTRSRVRYSEAASAHECLYVNFLSEIEPKIIIKSLEEGWVIAMQEELNQFERNKVWTLIPAPYGYRQEEGIDYDKTFAHVARLKAIRTFLAYAAYMGFMVYQMDVKSAFLNEKLIEEVYVQQLSGFESSEFPNYVYKLDKALYGLKQAPRACEMPHASPNNLGLDESGVSVNETQYRGMIRYIEGTPNLGCNLDRKSTSGGCQILGGNLVCWSAKKQNSVAMSSAEAEYVAAARCCAQVLWIKSQLACHTPPKAET